MIGRLERRFGPNRIIDLCFAATAVVLLGFGLLGGPVDAPQLWGLFAVSLIPLGLLLSLGQSVIASVVQVQVRSGMEGPVFALYAIVYTVVAPLGGLLLGWVADDNDVWVAVTVAGVGMLVLTAILVGLLERMRREEGEVEGGGAPVRRHGTHPVRLRLHHAQTGSFPLTRHDIDEPPAAAEREPSPA